MNPHIVVSLHATGEQHAKLLALQQAFAQVCNALAPRVQATRIWNRVALHHMAYKELREQFPALGSQLVCNAIYSVSRACRIVFQTPGSPFHASRWGSRPLPLLHFSADAPVYFDRHTLSIKDSTASMYTLDGRMKFQLALTTEQELAFHRSKLREIILVRAGQGFELQFILGEPIEELARNDVVVPAQPMAIPHIPNYLEIRERT
jgi:hypothetical protein